MISENEIIELIKKVEEGPTLDYKEDLPLAADGDKAELVKDIIALANSGEISHIIVGVEDGTGKPVGIKTHHKPEQINQILKDKCDPPISVEYIETHILGYEIGVIEIKGENPPYIVSVTDKFGGPLSTNPQKKCHIQRGTVFVRNYNMNDGAQRADLDKLYQVKYITLQADLEINHEVKSKHLDNLIEAHVNFFMKNRGDIIATDIYTLMRFKNIKRIVRCTGEWVDVSSFNNNIPTIQLLNKYPVMRPVNICCKGVIVQVESDVEQIEAEVIIGATNMRTKKGPYVIPLKEKE